MSDGLPPLLQPQELASQLSALEQLLAFYPHASGREEPTSASTLSDDAEAYIIPLSCAEPAQDVGAYLRLLDSGKVEAAGTLGAQIPCAFVLCIKLLDRSERQANHQVRTLVLDVELPLRTLKPLEAGDNRTRPHMALRQTEWMSPAVLIDRWHIVEMFASDVQRYDEQDVAELVKEITDFISLTYFGNKEANKGQRL